MMSQPQRPTARGPAPAPGVEVAEITAPTDPGGSLEALDQDLVQLEKRSLRARRLAVRLGDCLVIFGGGWNCS